jgi:hypothetical protein
LELYAEDATTLLESGESSNLGRLANVEWISDRNSQVFLRMRHLDGRVIGNGVSYTVKIEQGYHHYFPMLFK